MSDQRRQSLGRELNEKVQKYTNFTRLANYFIKTQPVVVPRQSATPASPPPLPRMLDGLMDDIVERRDYLTISEATSNHRA